MTSKQKVNALEFCEGLWVVPLLKSKTNADLAGEGLSGRSAQIREKTN